MCPQNQHLYSQEKNIHLRWRRGSRLNLEGPEDEPGREAWEGHFGEREQHAPSPHVTESAVRLLAAQKPIKRQGWWKGNFALFWMPATRAG